MEIVMPNSDHSRNRNELKSRLEELHDQLVSASQISTADKDMLGKMVVGILQLEDVQTLTSDTAYEQGFRDMLEQKSLAYEAQHPKLAFTLRQILDILSRMGI